MEPLWKVITEELPKVLIKPHTPEFDDLMRKFLAHTLTLPEAKSLLNLTRKMIAEGQREDNVLALVLFLPGVESRVQELQNNIGP